MVDKTTIDRSMKEALKNQSMDDAMRDSSEDFDQHKKEIIEAIDVVEGHSKSNKLLNILQVGEIAANFKRDKEAAEGAKEVKKFQEHQTKHNQGAKNSRSRIEGGIKDIKDMLGGDQPKTTQTEKLQGMFSQMKGGEGLGVDRQTLDANNIMASFSSQFQNVNQISELADKLDLEKNPQNKDDRNDLLSALNKISDRSANAKGKSGGVTQEERDNLKQAASKFGIDVDTSSKVTWPQAMGMGFNKDSDFDMGAVKKGFKGFRTMAQEDRLSKPLMGRSGIDVETIPEKNNEVLVAIYDLLVKWYNEMDGTGTVTPGFLAAQVRNRTNTTTTRTTGVPKDGYKTAKAAGQGAVQAKSGRWYPPNSTQGQTIINSGGGGSAAPRTRILDGPRTKVETLSNSPKVSSANNVLTKVANSKVVKVGGPVLSAGLEVFDTVQDINQINKREELGESDEAFLDEEEADRQRKGEMAEGTARFAAGSIAGTIAAGMIYTGLGTSTTGVGAVVGVPLALIGATIAYFAASEGAEAVTQEVRDRYDENLVSVKESGVYQYNRFGSSKLKGADDMAKEENLRTLSTGELQAIMRHNDLEDTDKLLVQRELENRGGSTSSAATMERIQGTTLPTGDAVENTQNDVDDAVANMELAKNVTINNNDNSVTDASSTTEMSKGSLSSNDSGSSTWDSFFGRNYVTTSRVG
jgi:hypothetical protein